jgi:hypothetical protein
MNRPNFNELVTAFKQEHPRKMESRANEPKEGKAQTIPRLGVQAQGRLCEEKGSLQREPTEGRCWWEI